jgi:hypothetical protein
MLRAAPWFFRLTMFESLEDSEGFILATSFDDSYLPLLSLYWFFEPLLKRLPAPLLVSRSTPRLELLCRFMR